MNVGDKVRWGNSHRAYEVLARTQDGRPIIGVVEPTGRVVDQIIVEECELKEKP